jgi:SlyX protein
MSSMIEQRLIELESKFAYQEDTLQTLSAEVHRQQQDIERLELRCRQLLERMADPSDGVFRGSLREEIPPHY